jgi:putative transposase
MRKARITAQYPKLNLSKLGLAGYIYPYLLRNLTMDHPNQVWEIDITYIPMDMGIMYLTAIIDVYSRFLLDGDFIIACMERT